MMLSLSYEWAVRETERALNPFKPKTLLSASQAKYNNSQHKIVIFC